MKGTLLTILCAGICLVLGNSSGWAFQTYYSSARSAGMGGAFMAASDESSTLFTNAAGLGGITSLQLSSCYGKPWLGLPDLSLWSGDVSVSIPSAYGNVGVGYYMFQADELVQEQTIALAYGLNVWKDILVGVTAKRLRHDYLIGSDPLAAADPLFKDGHSQSGVAVDAGVVLPLGRLLGMNGGQVLSLGLVGRNLNQPDLGLVTEDKVLREIETGLLWDVKSTGLKVTADILLHNSAPGQMVEEPLPSFGLEKLVAGDNLAIRFGYNSLEMTGGFRIKYQGIILDYSLAFKLNLMSDNLGSHKIGLTYILGGDSRPAKSVQQKKTMSENKRLGNGSNRRRQ